VVAETKEAALGIWPGKVWKFEQFTLEGLKQDVNALEYRFSLDLPIMCFNGNFESNKRK